MTGIADIPLPFTAIKQPQVDRLGWTSGRSFSAYGLRLGLRANDQAVLAAAQVAVPLSWQAVATGEVDILYSLRVEASVAHQRRSSDYLLYCDSTLLARAHDLTPLLTTFTQHAELLTAYRAQDHLFIHAGVVGWQGRAILIPGRSMSGKTSLVRALVAAGATYYSDEFAVLDQQGLVHPYAVPLSIRGMHGQPAQKTPVEALGGQVGRAPLPVGLVVVTAYQPRARWRPAAISAGQALLALMDNAVAARREPSYSMPILRATITATAAVQSKRGEADAVARALLRRFTS
jgi:hypothetical protein